MSNDVQETIRTSFFETNGGKTKISRLIPVTEIPSDTSANSTSDKPTNLDHEGEGNFTTSSKNETATSDELDEANNGTKERLIRFIEQRLKHVKYRVIHLVADWVWLLCQILSEQR